MRVRVRVRTHCAPLPQVQMAGFTLGIDSLLLLLTAFMRSRREAQDRRRTSQWWVSGRSPEGTQRHYLLRVG